MNNKLCVINTSNYEYTFIKEITYHGTNTHVYRLLPANSTPLAECISCDNCLVTLPTHPNNYFLAGYFAGMKKNVIIYIPEKTSVLSIDEQFLNILNSKVIKGQVELIDYLKQISLSLIPNPIDDIEDIILV